MKFTKIKMSILFVCLFGILNREIYNNFGVFVTLELNKTEIDTFINISDYTI